jgi:hypothetical protein
LYRQSTELTEQNPYAPSVESAKLAEVKNAKWHLDRVQKYFRRMGFAGLLYTGCVFVLTITIQLQSGKLRIPETVGSLVLFGLMAWLFIDMIRIGYLPEAQFSAHYTKARWILIVVGTVFLPILGVPAFISLRRMTQYNLLVNREVAT